MPGELVLWIVALASTAAGLRLLLRYVQRQRHRKAALLTTISQLGSHHNLSFTGQEVLGQSVIGIDGLKKKLLVLENRGPVYRWYTINLQEVSSCSVQKTYRPGAGASPLRPAISGYVDRVELLFHCRDRAHPMTVPFYSAERNEPAELPALEARARSWQCFLSKLLPARQEGRA